MKFDVHIPYNSVNFEPFFALNRIIADLQMSRFGLISSATLSHLILMNAL